MILAFIGAIGEIAQFAIQVSSNQMQNLISLVLNLLIALSIPYCGWRGAKDDDQSMLCWFCGCNFAEACYTGMIVVWVHQHVAYWGDVCDECEEVRSGEERSDELRRLH